MKHILLILLLALCSLATSAQKLDVFRIQTDGSLKIESTNKNFIVVEYPGKTAEELRTKIINNVTKVFKDPKRVMSTSEDVVTVRGFESGVTVYKDAMWGNKTWNIDYTITFQFKDGKIRVDVPSVEIVNQYGSRDYLSDIVRKLLVDSDGKFKQKRLENIKNLEYKINSIFIIILTCDEKKDSEDW